MQSTHLDSTFGSGVRRSRKSIRSARRAATPNLTHLTPQPYLDPIREVKRESIHWKRKLFHVLGIGTAGFAYALINVGRWEAAAILGAIAALFVFLDGLRFFVPALNKKVKKDFGPLMRDYELDGLSGSSWFLISAVLAVAVFPKAAAYLGIIYLALGDPLASFVGVRWGRIRMPGGKSLEGSAALFALCSVVGYVLLTLLAGLTPAVALPVALGTGLAAAFAEALPSKRIDDNFVVPLLTGGVATLLLNVFV